MDLPHIVIVGGGFAGLQAAKALRKAPVRVTLVDRQNFHLFQPLLYQVATGGLSPANIATPLRLIVRKFRNCSVLMSEVTGFDMERKVLRLADGELPFDSLVLAAGATHSYFGNDAWQKNAPGLKSLADATGMRSRIFRAFEAAERETDPARRAQWLTFVVVGGGPTGVELAGALAEIARHTLRKDYRNISTESARILLVEAAPRVLGNYPDELCAKAKDSIQSLGVEVLTETKVTSIDEDCVRLEHAGTERTEATRTVLWAAGVKGNSLGEKIAQACGVETDRIGRVPVETDLSVAGHQDVFVIGDLAACVGADGRALPGLAPVAMQQGKFVGGLLRKRSEGKPGPQTFRYRDPGTMATIGRARAVAQRGKRTFSGWFAWLMWLFVHLMQIVQFQNRVLVLFQWSWYYLTFNRSARIITRSEDDAALDAQSTDLLSRDADSTIRSS